MYLLCLLPNRCSHTTSSCFVVTSNSISCRRAANPCEGSDGSQRSPLHSGEDTISAAQAWNNLTCYDASGLRSNALQGSRIYKDNIAAANDALIDVLEDSGAIVIGKTNTPEFGAGANTFNEYAKLRFMVPAFSRFLDPASPDPACAANHANQPLIISMSTIPLLDCSLAAHCPHIPGSQSSGIAICKAHSHDVLQSLWQDSQSLGQQIDIRRVLGGFSSCLSIRPGRLLCSFFFVFHMPSYPPACLHADGDKLDFIATSAP